MSSARKSKSQQVVDQLTLNFLSASHLADSNGSGFCLQERNRLREPLARLFRDLHYGDMRDPSVRDLRDDYKRFICACLLHLKQQKLQQHQKASPSDMTKIDEEEEDENENDEDENDGEEEEPHEDDNTIIKVQEEEEEPEEGDPIVDALMIDPELLLLVDDEEVEPALTAPAAPVHSFLMEAAWPTIPLPELFLPEEPSPPPQKEPPQQVRTIKFDVVDPAQSNCGVHRRRGKTGL